MNSIFGAAGFCTIAFLMVAPIHAQMGQNTGPESGAAVGTDGIARITGTRSPWGTPATTNSNSSNIDQSRTVFLRGSVMFDDGTPPGSGIRIERICGSSVQVEAHTDSKGRFSFELGGNAASSIADADSSNESLGTARSATDGLSGPGDGSGGAGASGLVGCALRAAYPGYASELVDLARQHALNDHSIGTILLHRRSNVRGTTISVTSAQAPKSAQKSYEKGYQLSQKGNFPAAEAKFRSATSDYPKFAIAWFALGQVQYRQNKPGEAIKSYLAAIAADYRYVSPYEQLALLSGEQENWEEAAQYSREAIELNPVEFPSCYWYNALANYNLKRDAEAEKSARMLVKLDLPHRFPQGETMLAEFAENRGEWQGAATHLRAFLAEAPGAPNAEAVKQQLVRIEAAASVQAKRATVAPH